MPGSRSVRTGEKGKQAAKKAREQQRTASDRLSPGYFALFVFYPFPQSLGAWNRLMNSLCAVWGWGGKGGEEGDSPPFFPSSYPSPLDACWLRATPFSGWSPWHHVKTFHSLRYAKENSPCESQFLYTSLPSLHDYNVKLPKFTFYGGQDNDFRF